jgi:hypothetical protein
MGGFMSTYVQVPAEDAGHLFDCGQPSTALSGPAERETTSLGYYSITYTASEELELVSPKLELSDVIKNSRGNPKVEQEYGHAIDAFYKWAQVTENYWVSAISIKPACKCVSDQQIAASIKAGCKVDTGKSWGYTRGAFPLHNRFSQTRRNQKLLKIYKIMEYEEAKYGTTTFTLVTLTASHDGGFSETFDRLCKGRGLLMKILRKYLPKLRSVWVVEPHPNGSDIGYPHIHLVLACRVDNSVKDSQGRGMEDKLRELWSEEWELGSHTFGLDFKVIENSNQALNYILSYTGKSFVSERGWGQEELIFNTMLYACSSNEDNPRVYRTMGLCKEYSDLFKKKEEPSVCLDARLFPIVQEIPGNLDGDVYPEKQIIQRPQLIPDWLGNRNLVDSISKGSPDYTTRFKYDKAGKPLPRPPSHWGRPNIETRPI